MENKFNSSEMYTKIVNKVLKDETFKNKLLENPRRAIEEEFRIQIPKNLDIKIFEDTEKSKHFVIPWVGEENLTEQELQKIAGGGSWADEVKKRKAGGALEWGITDTAPDRK